MFFQKKKYSFNDTTCIYLCHLNDILIGKKISYHAIKIELSIEYSQMLLQKLWQVTLVCCSLQAQEVWHIFILTC